MNYRQISTKIWRDEKFVELGETEQRLVLYLITNHLIGLIPAYKISPREIMFDLGTNKQKLDQCIKAIRKVGIYFVDGYCIFDNDFANYFVTGGKTDNERHRQIDSLPENIKKWVLSEIIIGQLLGNDCSTIETITPNITPNIKYSKIEDIKEEDFLKISEMYKVPMAFVSSKFDDMCNWHDKNPQKNYYKNYLSALKDWVKKDSLKIKQEYAKQNSDLAL